MKRLPCGTLICDKVDVFLISLTFGSVLGHGFILYRKVKKSKFIINKSSEDPIVTELKNKSRKLIPSTRGKLIKLPLLRGGDEPRIVLIRHIIRNQRLNRLIRRIAQAKKKERLLQLLNRVFYIPNQFLKVVYMLNIAVGGATNTEIIIFSVTGTASGFLLTLLSSYPILTLIFPMAIMYSRGIEDIPDPQRICRLLCKVAEQHHNRELVLEMQNMESLIKDYPLLAEGIPAIAGVECVEQKLSLLERFKLRQLIPNDSARKRVQNFSEFIKNFKECDADREAIIEEFIKSNITEAIKVRN